MSARPGAQDRTARLGWAAILIPLALGFVLSLALAYEALDAAREHRKVVRSTVREQAEFAAHLLGTSVDRSMRQALLYGFYPLDIALGRAGEPPPAAALVTEPEISRCDGVLARGDRAFFRLDPVAGQVDLAGAGSPELEEWLTTTLGPRLRDGGDEAPYGHVTVTVDGRRRLIAYRRWERNSTVIVYGFDSCWRVANENVFETAVANTQAFPPSLVGATPNDSLFWLAARAGDGELAYGERWNREAGAFYGTTAVAPAAAYGGLELRVTIRPEVAARLVVGGLPRSRVPIALGLVALTALLMLIAVGQLRRGHELVRLRGQFVRSVSHELRTPLQQILLFTELLQSGRLTDPTERRRALDIMVGETRRLIELVANVLRFSTPGEPALRRVSLDLSEVATETIEGFRPLADSRGARIQLDVTARPIVHADHDGVKRILINLLDNAVKFGPEDQTIRVCICTTNGRGEVVVSDQGPGIDRSHRDRIWQAFNRLEDASNGAVAGSGIGLSIVRRLADAMNGGATVEENPDGGAAFRVWFPTVEPDADHSG